MSTIPEYLVDRFSSQSKTLGPRVLPATPDVSLDAAGLVALADLTTIQKRTALTGTAVFLDALVLCPGIHMQRESTSLNGGEYPACAALTTGYVFRIENPATVFFLQQIGRTGQLTVLTVSRPDRNKAWFSRISSAFLSLDNATPLSVLAYGVPVLWTVVVIVLLFFYHDWWGLAVVLILVFARLCNIVVIRRRAVPGWAGASEPGKTGDLLVLLSQDRWVRIKGKVDDLKLATSGQWLRDERKVEGWITALATVAVYLDAALASNATQFGQILLLALLIGSVGFLAVANAATEKLQMHGIVMTVDPDRIAYNRRRDLADELIKETGRDDWAVRLGMIVKDTSATAERQPATM